jgi:hypothetical protein
MVRGGANNIVQTELYKMASFKECKVYVAA